MSWRVITACLFHTTIKFEEIQDRPYRNIWTLDPSGLDSGVSLNKDQSMKRQGIRENGIRLG